MSGSGDHELLSVVEPTGRPLPPLGRAEVHQRGLWHESIHCLIVRPAPVATVVLQRRRDDARSFAGLLDLSATGHLAAGETPLDGRREITEELGIEVDPDALVYLGARLMANDMGEGGANRERIHVFLLADDRALEAFPFDPGEVAGLVELTIADLLLLVADPTAVVPAREIAAGAGDQVVETTCRASDLIPPVDGYLAVVAVMAERFAAGLRPLAI